MFIYQWNCIIYVLILYFNLLWKKYRNKLNQIKSNQIKASMRNNAHSARIGAENGKNLKSIFEKSIIAKR